MKLASINKGILVALVSVVAACDGGGVGGGDKDCVDLCTEAQAGACTSIDGNCTSFCNALDAVDGPANCTSQNSAYQSCLNEGALVCDNSCAAAESSLSNCIAVYCATRQSEPNCATLIASF